jgi:uncharacterized protein (TIGR04255 family)
MPFPVASRVRYAHHPIEFILCQLRFPPILRIDAEVPSRFQDAIRDRYPLYEAGALIGLPPGLPPEVANLISQGLPLGPGQRSHRFIDATGNWTLTLDRENLTLHCRRYESWEEFNNFFAPSLNALRGVYSPPFFLRTGLRYRDVIRRSEHRLEGVEWSDLLQPWIAGPYFSPDVSRDIERTAHQALIRLSDGEARVLVNHGVILDERSKEPCYVIDADFFDETRTGDSDAIARLENLHRQARYFFRWCITDRLHAAMGPEPIPGTS